MWVTKTFRKKQGNFFVRTWGGQEAYARPSGYFCTRNAPGTAFLNEMTGGDALPVLVRPKHDHNAKCAFTLARV